MNQYYGMKDNYSQKHNRSSYNNWKVNLDWTRTHNSRAIFLQLRTTVRKWSVYLSFRNTRVKGEYSKSESIEMIYFNCGIKMLLDRYHLTEARDEIEVVAKTKAENTIRQRDITKT